MPIGFRRMAAAMAVAASVAGPGVAEQAFPYIARGEPVAHSESNPDPCAFFRGQTYRKALSDYTREMLWACEEIARRRAAHVALGDRLEATAAILDAYQEGVYAAAGVAFDRNRLDGLPPWALGLSEDEKYAIADATGALLALEAIRNGF